MSVLDPVYRFAAFCKFRKPQTFTYGHCPQSIKPVSVTVKPTDPEGLYEGSDGELYVKQPISCKKNITFSDGQKLSRGDAAYFRIEPVVWEIGGRSYIRKEIKDRRGKVKKTVDEKTENSYCVTKYVLAPMGDAQKAFLVTETDEKVMPRHKVHSPDSYGYAKGCYSLDCKISHAAKSNLRKKATDYAKACGVAVKGQYAYHTRMSNGLCAHPNGKCKDLPAKSTAGELLCFSEKSDTMSLR